MYADRITDSMQRAIDETQRRRTVQERYNEEHHITPKTIVKPVINLIETTLVAEGKAEYNTESGRKRKLSKKERESLLKTLTHQMQEASRALEFERAAELRDMIYDLEDSRPGKKG